MTRELTEAERELNGDVAEEVIFGPVIVQLVRWDTTWALVIRTGTEEHRITSGPEGAVQQLEEILDGFRRAARLRRQAP